MKTCLHVVLCTLNLPLCDFSVETVGGGGFEKKMLHVKLALGNPLQAVTPTAFTNWWIHAQWSVCLHSMYNIVKKNSMYINMESIIHIFECPCCTVSF